MNGTLEKGHSLLVLIEYSDMINTYALRQTFLFNNSGQHIAFSHWLDV
jgi:hypothetical protein